MWHHIPEDLNSNLHSHENLKSHSWYVHYKYKKYTEFGTVLNSKFWRWTVKHTEDLKAKILEKD